MANSNDLKKFNSKLILPDGFGYGVGKISYKSRLDGGLDPRLADEAKSLIQSDEILVELGLDDSGKPIQDDGCGDGRSVGEVFVGQSKKKKSLHRPKVFGGGLMMAAACLVGLGKTDSNNLVEVFKQASELERQKGVKFGLHSDDHAAGKSCGCGAIDNALPIINNIVLFRRQISQTITGLGLGFTNEQLDEVFDNFEEANERLKNCEYCGRDVFDAVADEDIVLKQLKGEHLEMFVVLNSVGGYTVNQQKVRDAGTELVQAFAVDLWRLSQIANRLFGDDDKAELKALISELVYTLSTALTLTAGDLPVYLVEEQH
jgi:hypothetical protein